MNPESPTRSIVVYTTDPWEGAIPTLRYKAAAERLGWQVLRGNQGDQDIEPGRVDEADLVIIQRDFPRYLAEYDEIVERARAAQKPVVYETDDLLLELPEDHVAVESYVDALAPMLRAICEADAVTVSTRALGKALQPFNPNIFWLPNCLIDELWPAPSQSIAEEGPVVIGYMGGGTHRPDLETILPALQNIQKRYGERVKLRFWGGKPPDGLEAGGAVEWIEMDVRNYAEFARYFHQQSCSIFLAPLRDHLFNRCKSAIKFLEYSVLGIPGVYSRIRPYQEVIEDGKNGFLAANSEEWEASLIQLIEDARLRREMGRKAEETVRAGWMLSQHDQEWGQVYRRAKELAASRSQENALLSERLGEFSRRVEARRQDYETAIRTLRGIIVERDKTLRELDERSSILQNQLNDILESRSWKTMQKLQKIRTTIAPRKTGP